MKVLLLGATGTVGREVLDQALLLGHSVRVLVRVPAKLKAHEGRLEVLTGDALDGAALEHAVNGCEAVVYCLGERVKGKETRLFSESTRLLIAAMEKAGVKRLIALTGIGAGETKGHGGWFYDWIIYPLFTRKIYEDKDRQEDLIRKSSLDWTIVRAASFTDGPLGGRLRATDQLEGVTIAKISRADTAAFLLDQLRSGAWLRRAPLVGY
jgi:putative NADH-flavin reductase